MESHLFQFIFIIFAIFLHESLIQATTLDVMPTTLQHSGNNITIILKDVHLPSEFDWLGIYMPSTSLDDQYIGYILLSSCSTWKTGTCSLQIPLINMRSPYNF
jgi:hypothetical protein